MTPIGGLADFFKAVDPLSVCAIFDELYAMFVESAFINELLRHIF